MRLILGSCDGSRPSICGIINDDISNEDDVWRRMIEGVLNHEWERMRKEAVMASYNTPFITTIMSLKG